MTNARAAVLQPANVLQSVWTCRFRVIIIRRPGRRDAFVEAGRDHKIARSIKLGVLRQY